MRAPTFSHFEHEILQSRNEVGSSVLLLLTWIAASDGAISAPERSQILQIAQSANYTGNINLLMKLARDANQEALKLASEILQRHFHGDAAQPFLEMAIGVSISDRYLKPPENHIIRYLADTLGISRLELETIFKEVTGRPLPDSSDPSRAEYWGAKESRQSSSRSQANSSRRDQSPPRNQQTINAYAVLGVEFGAPIEEIKNAYKRLAQVHHPDRFSKLGDESVAAATLTFQRIQAAYNHLMTNA